MNGNSWVVGTLEKVLLSVTSSPVTAHVSSAPAAVVEGYGIGMSATLPLPYSYLPLAAFLDVSGNNSVTYKHLSGH